MPDETDEDNRPADPVRRALDEFLDRLARAVAGELAHPTPSLEPRAGTRPEDESHEDPPAPGPSAG
jgi:hypothetical protein